MTRHPLLPCAFLFLLLLTSACQTASTASNPDAEPIEIHRFDRALLAYIDADSTHAPALGDSLRHAYPEMLRVLSLALFEHPDTTDTTPLDRLADYYSEPNLHRLYADAISHYPDPTVDSLGHTLGAAFARLRADLPGLPTPAICFHVSGLYQNVLVGDSLLSLSIDKYLGADYPLYTDFFPPYARRRMTPAHVAPDLLAAHLMSEYPFHGNEAVLLDRMIYEGALRYAVLRALPTLPVHTLMGWTPEELSEVEHREPDLWRLIIERHALYTPDRTATARYFLDRPSDFLSDKLPGRLGTWIGLRIVSRYMDRTHAPLDSLLRTTDAQSVLTASKYRPR